MSRIELISQAGGLFACLVFIHFFSDFLFQSHAEAMVKHKNHKIRAKHCAIYTAFFVPWFVFFHFSWWQWLVGLSVLFWSHNIEDTYAIVYLWAKYIRRPPEMNTDPNKGFIHDPKIGLGKFVVADCGFDNV